MKIHHVDEISREIDSTITTAINHLRDLIGDAEIHHVGATAIPGAITKGDVDIVVRVASTEFSTIIEALSKLFERKQVENWSGAFGSFGDDDGYDLPLGIQVVVRGTENDIFLYLRDYLRTHPDALQTYNSIKSLHANDKEDGYRKAKDAFFTEILRDFRPA